MAFDREEVLAAISIAYQAGQKIGRADGEGVIDLIIAETGEIEAYHRHPGESSASQIYPDVTVIETITDTDPRTVTEAIARAMAGL